VLGLSYDKRHSQIQLSPAREQVSKQHHLQWLPGDLIDAIDNDLFVTGSFPSLTGAIEK
jgi:hypothetical protein